MTAKHYIESFDLEIISRNFMEMVHYFMCESMALPSFTPQLKAEYSSTNRLYIRFTISIER